MAREPVEAAAKAPVADRLRERVGRDAEGDPLLVEAATEIEALKARVAELEAAIPAPSVLPDPGSPEAVKLLQRALGNVTVDGVIGAQTMKAFRRLKDRGGFHAELERQMGKAYGAADQDFIASMLQRLA
jgi:hypothetical protein